jgi:hypothetical protein
MADPPRAYDEKDWNDSALKAVEEKGAEAGVHTMYNASKVLAERGMWRLISKLTTGIHDPGAAAWDFYKKHKDEVSWDLTVICPPLVRCTTMT